MTVNIVEIGEDGLRLSLYRGFLKISDAEGERGRVPLDNMLSLVISAPDAQVSKNIIVTLAARNIPVIFCGQNWRPASIAAPIEGHHQGAGFLFDQINTSAPLQKRLWQTLVRAKIRNQAITLKKHRPNNPKAAEIDNLVRRVRSGDPDNMEAQAARLYWKALMGDDFRRDKDGTQQNALLNYGYTVLRAATARAVTGAGLHPALGVHHRNRKNSFALVDDLMEPFRPLVDDHVLQIWDEHEADFPGLTPEIKKRLTAILWLDLRSEKGASPVMNCLQQTAISLRESICKKEHLLTLPDLPVAGAMF